MPEPGTGATGEAPAAAGRTAAGVATPVTVTDRTGATTVAAGDDHSARAPRRRPRRGLLAAAVVVLLAQMAAGMLLSLRDDAPTYDEPAHLAAGVGYLEYRSLRLNPEHPPLVKLIAAVPVVLSRQDWPPAERFERWPQYDAGRRILFGSSRPPTVVLALARLPMILLALALAVAVLGFAADLFGARAALLPLALVTLDPNVLAHGRLVTTDLPATLFLLCTAWMLWRVARRGWGWLPLAGLAYGLALVTKYSAIVLAPVVAVLTVLALLWGARGGRLRRLPAALAGTAAVGLIALGVIWATYLAIDPALRFDEQGALPGLVGTAIARLPLPEPYRYGLIFVLAHDGGRPAFLLGERYVGGRLDFYPIALAIKTPLAMLATWAAALVAVGASRRRWELAAFVLLMPAVVLAVSMTSSLNIGVRHVLAVPVALAVASGALAAAVLGGRARDAASAAEAAADGPARPALSAGRWAAVTVLAVAVLLTGAGTWRVHPSYLAYVNEAFGGPERGRELLADSNLDWGQDLARAADRVRADHPGERVWLLYFGSAVPARYGLDAPDLRADKVPLDQVHGIVVASASAVNLFDDPPSRLLRERGTVIDDVGGSIQLYRVP